MASRGTTSTSSASNKQDQVVTVTPPAAGTSAGGVVVITPGGDDEPTPHDDARIIIVPVADDGGDDPPVIGNNQLPPERQKKTEKKKKRKHRGPNSHLYRTQRGLPPFPNCTYRFLPDFVAWVFGCYGYALGKCPWVFLALGVATGAVCAAGLMKIQLATDDSSLINQFLEMDSRYLSDDAVIQAWKNNSQQLNSLSTQAFLNNKQPAENNNNNNGTHRSKREAGPVGPCDWNTYSQYWRIESVIIAAKNNSLIDDVSLSDAFRLSYMLRETLVCDQDDSTEQAARLHCCDSWDIQRMKYEIFDRSGESDDTMTPGELMKSFFTTLTYPADKRFKLSETSFTNFLGGVTRLDAINGYNAKVTGFKAMRFQYVMSSDLGSTLPLEARMHQALKDARSKYKKFDIYWASHNQLQEEFLTEVVLEEIPKVGATFITVIIWCIVGTLHIDVLTSKPWSGLVGISCTAFAIAAGFGGEFWMGDYFYTYLVAVPLMALAIGLDDMFILLNNWHKTDVRLPREERAKITMQEGATSIFVTVVMTILDFVVGSYTPYPAVQTYSNFALWCLAFDFWLQLTIFMSVLALSDGCEKRSLHSCCCCAKVTKRNYRNITHWSACHVICCTYGRVDDAEEEEDKKPLPTDDDKPYRIYENIENPPEPEPPEPTSSDAEAEADETKANVSNNNDEHDENEFSTGKRIIYLYIAPFLLHGVSRMIVMILTFGFIVTCAVFIWAKVRIGFHPEYLANRKSNTYDFEVYQFKYFKDFSDVQQLQVLFNFTTEPFGGNFVKIKKKVSEIASKIEAFETYIWGRRLNTVPLRDIAIANSTNMTLWDAIHSIADQVGDTAMKPAILNPFTDDERIISLCYFQIKDVSELESGAELARRLKEIQSTYESGSDFVLYMTDAQQMLRVYDQIVSLPSQFIYFTLITICSTVVTSVVMIPNPICIFWMALASMCIIVGTLGGMVMWNVGLDPVSLVYILMAIGATADYICHCIYTFTVIHADVKPDEAKKITWATIRYRKARHLIADVIAETGPAVVGTTLAIVVLSTSNNYVMEAFFKVFFVAVLVAFTFMCVIIPVALCQFGPVTKTCCEQEAFTLEEEPSEYEEVIIPAAMSEHAYENNAPSRKPRKSSTPQLPQLDAVDAISIGKGPLVTKPNDDYEVLVKLRLLRRFLRDSQTFTSTSFSGVSRPSATDNSEVFLPDDEEDIFERKNAQPRHLSLTANVARRLQVADNNDYPEGISNRHGSRQTRHFSLANTATAAAAAPSNLAQPQHRARRHTIRAAVPVIHENEVLQQASTSSSSAGNNNNNNNNRSNAQMTRQQELLGRTSSNNINANNSSKLQNNDRRHNSLAPHMLHNNPPASRHHRASTDDDNANNPPVNRYKNAARRGTANV